MNTEANNNTASNIPASTLTLPETPRSIPESVPGPSPQSPGQPRPRRKKGILHNLPHHQKAELHDRLARHPRAQVLKLLCAPASQGGWGLKLGYNTLKRYEEEVLTQYDTRAKKLDRYWAAYQAVQAVPAPYTQLAHQHLREYYFDLAIKPWSDPKLLKQLHDQIVREEELLLKHEHLRLKRRETEIKCEYHEAKVARVKAKTIECQTRTLKMPEPKPRPRRKNAGLAARWDLASQASCLGLPEATIQKPAPNSQVPSPASCQVPASLDRVQGGALGLQGVASLANSGKFENSKTAKFVNHVNAATNEESPLEQIATLPGKLPSNSSTTVSPVSEFSPASKETDYRCIAAGGPSTSCHDSHSQSHNSHDSHSFSVVHNGLLTR